jgi:hypothetical protein
MIHEHLLILNADCATAWKGEDAPCPHHTSHRPHGSSLPSSEGMHLATMTTNAKEGRSSDGSASCEDAEDRRCDDVRSC